MKKRLNDEVMVPGDIVLSTSDGLISKKIRVHTGSDVSHAMLYVTHCSVIHAVSKGVHAENTQRILFDENDAVYVLRLKGGLPELTAKKICEHVRTAVGTQYSKLEAVKAKSERWSKSTRKQFCSRLVAQAYDKEGYRLVPNPDYCAPGAFLKSDLLEPVPNGTVLVSDAEQAFLESIENTPDIMAATFNDILSEIRKYDRNVQNLTDIGQFVIDNPNHDKAVHDIIVKSGYLDLWKLDYREGPWRYDISEMEKQPDKKQLLMYCMDVVGKTEGRDDNRFTNTYKTLLAHSSRYPRMTFLILIDLYKKLIELHAKRHDAAALWLKRNAGFSI